MSTPDLPYVSPRLVPQAPRGWYSRFVFGLQGAYFGIIAMSLVIATIIGAVALMFIFKHHAGLWEIVLCVGLVLANNIIPVAQQSLKWIVGLFIVSVSVNALLIAVNAW